MKSCLVVFLTYGVMRGKVRASLSGIQRRHPFLEYNGYLVESGFSDKGQS